MGKMRHKTSSPKNTAKYLIPSYTLCTDCSSLITEKDHPNSCRRLCVFVCSLMAVQANFSSKLSVANRACEFGLC